MPEWIGSIVSGMPQWMQFIVVGYSIFLIHKYGPEVVQRVQSKIKKENGNESNSRRGSQSTNLIVESLRDDLLPLMQRIHEEIKVGNELTRQEFSRTRAVIRDHDEKVQERVAILIDAIHDTQLMLKDVKR